VLKTRIIPTLLYRNHTLVKGVAFDSWRTVGAVMQAVEVYNLREVDELVLLDITATSEGRPPAADMVQDLAGSCFIPLAVGGGVRQLGDLSRLLHAGADKVLINSAAAETPAFIDEASREFGAQCVVVSIDVRQVAGRGRVVTHSGTRVTSRDPLEFAIEVAERGAGEILLTSIERDGTQQGYDLHLIRRVADGVRIPVIAAGGAGTYEHMVAAIRDGHASAVAAASMFHFTEQTPLEAKRYMSARGIPVRKETAAGLL
jgi:imidazole glycerol-phosphate synthase subunit HisF